MPAFQTGVLGPLLLFVLLPAVALAVAMALSVYEVYRIGERKLLVITAILALMLQHQLLEAYAFYRTGEAVAEGVGEIFETGANLIAAGSVYYVLRFARRERRLVRDLEQSEQQYRSLIAESPVPVLLHGADEIRYANDAAADLFDADDRSALDGAHLSAFLAGEQSEEVRETVLTDGGSDVVEGRLHTLDGRTRHAALTGAPANYEGEDVRQVVVQDLTEQKRREREYEQIFHGVHDALVIHDPETGEMVDVNDTLCELLGYEREEILELGTGGISAQEEGYTQERAEEIIAEVVEEGEVGPFEWVVETSDGEHRVLEVRATTAEIGGQVRHVSINRDITERKRREQEYEQIFNSVTNGITVFHPETGAILDVNDTYHEMLGYEDLETIQELGIAGLSVTEEGYTGERGVNLIREVAETGETQTVEWRGERADGTRLWLEATLVPAEIGGEQRVLSIQRDVTERKRREREYEQMFESVQDGIIVWDPETLDILDANEAYMEMLGYDDIETLRSEGVGGLSVTEEGYTEERGREIHQRVAETGESELVEWRGETSDGERLWLEVKITPVVIGGQQRTISINRDITERKQREQRLEVFNRILRHNLRNRLDVIKGHAEALANDADGDHAEQVLTAADRLATVGTEARRIDRLMSRERTESQVDLAAVVQEALDAIESPTDGITVTVDGPETAPVTTDAEVLELVLRNVLDNAVQYGDSAVSVTLESATDGYVVTVDDDGPGIPREELAPIDAGTETDLEHGRGMGLWQVKWGVKKLNGDVAFETNGGTTVRLSIPNLRAGDADSG